MAKPKEVLSTEVIAKGGELEAEINVDGKPTFVRVVGLESLPQLGTQGGFSDARSFDQTDPHDNPAIQTTEELEFIFKRIGDDRVQNAMLAAAQAPHTNRKAKLIKIKAYYNSGDILETELLMGRWYLGEVGNDDEAHLMLGLSGKPQTIPATSQVSS